jgi:hypothetical protein
VQFNTLGPLEVVDQDRALPLGGIKQRAMLGRLLLRANRVVASSKLLTHAPGYLLYVEPGSIDLIEAGTMWPEIGVVQNTHLVVVEERQ